MSESVCQCQPIACSPGKMTRTRRIATLAGYLLPSALLVFIPKCPMCFAAYLAFATGLGISVNTAGYLRMAVICLCFVFLAFAVTPRLLKLSHRLAEMLFLAK